MSQEQSRVRTDAQAGNPGKAAAVGPEVGGVRSNDDQNWVDLWALSPEYRRQLREVTRDAACSQALPRSKGAGDGSQEITTPESFGNSNARSIAKPRPSRAIGSGASTVNSHAATCWSMRFDWWWLTAVRRGSMVRPSTR